MAHCTVRLADKADSHEIWRLLKEQEDNDPESSRLFLSLETLKRDGFGARKFFYIIVAEDITTEHSEKGSRLVGYLFYNMIFCSWSGKIMLPKDLYVTPAFRNKGIARKLWNFLCKIVLEENFVKIQWNIKNHKKDLLKLSEGSGAAVEDESYYIFRLSKSSILKVE